MQPTGGRRSQDWILDVVSGVFMAGWYTSGGDRGGAPPLGIQGSSVLKALGMEFGDLGSSAGFWWVALRHGSSREINHPRGWLTSLAAPGQVRAGWFSVTSDLI